MHFLLDPVPGGDTISLYHPPAGTTEQTCGFCAGNTPFFPFKLRPLPAFRSGEA
jgi:hypothetical protein